MHNNIFNINVYYISTVKLHGEQGSCALLVGSRLVAQPEVDDMLLAAAVSRGVAVQQNVAVATEEVPELR